MSIETLDQLYTHNKLGASWEGFALECVHRVIEKRDEELFFWSTHAGAEVDLFWQHRGKNRGIEFKYSNAPEITKSMRIAFKDLNLSHLWIVYPGPTTYKLSKDVTVQSLKDISDFLR